MAEKKMCPHCGGQMFMVKTIRAGIVEITTDTDNPYNILKENKDKFEIEIVGCARCKEAVTEDTLVTGVKCKECGRIVGPMDVNADGICNVCEAVKQRTELANASREDLIKMLLDAEKKTNPVVAKMEKQIEKAEEVVATAPVAVAESEDAQPEEEKKKTTRRATRRKKDDADTASETVETTEPLQEEESAAEVAEVATAEVTEAVEDIANQQEAPFPDIAMNLPVEEAVAPVETVVETPVQQEEQPIGADFRMFDEEEEAF